MTIFHKLVKGGSDLLNSFKSENKKQLAELERLEKKIEELQVKKEKPAHQNMLFDYGFFLKFWIIGLLIVFVAYISFQSLEILYLIFAAYIVSLAVEVIIEFLQKKIYSRVLSIAITYILLAVIFIAALFFIIPFLLTQVSDIITLLTGNITNFQHVLETKSLASLIGEWSWIPGSMKSGLVHALGDPSLGGGIQNKLQDNINQLINLGSTYAKDIGSFAVNFVGSFLSILTQASIVLTLAVLFSLQKEAVMKFIAGLWGEKEYKFIYLKLENIYKKLGIWLKSQLLLCVFIGLMMFGSFRALTLFGMDLPNKLSLSLIGAFTELIPYFGPIIGGSVAVIVAFVHFGWTGALVVAAIIFVIQRLENNFLIPLLMNKTLGVNPVVIFISMLLGSLVIGFVGVLLAVPISVIITMAVDGRFEERKSVNT